MNEPEFDEDKYVELKKLKAAAEFGISTAQRECDKITEDARKHVAMYDAELAEMEAKVFEQMDEGRECEYEHTKFVVKTGPRTMKPGKGFHTEFKNLIAHLPSDERVVAEILIIEKRTITFKPEGVATIEKICDRVPFLQDNRAEVDRILGVTPGRRIEKVEHEAKQ